MQSPGGPPKAGMPKYLIVLLTIGALLFVVAGGIAVYAAIQASNEVLDVTQDLSKPPE